MATAHITYFFPVGSLHARETENLTFYKKCRVLWETMFAQIYKCNWASHQLTLYHTIPTFNNPEKEGF